MSASKSRQLSMVRSNVCIDFGYGLRSQVGDSQCQQRDSPLPILTNLQAWIQARFGQKYKITGSSIKSGTQRDTSSCGLFAINMIEHAIFGDMLCEQNDIPAY